MGKMIKFLVTAVLLAVIAFGGYTWLQGREPSGDGLELIPVERGSITEKAVAIGQIEPRIEFHVKSKISGIVSRCAVEVGDPVQPGDALFEISPDPTPIELVTAERDFESRQSAFRRAESDWKRTSELDRQGIVSGDEVDAARESYELARIQPAERNYDAVAWYGLRPRDDIRGILNPTAALAALEEWLAELRRFCHGPARGNALPQRRHSCTR